jgi:hypothetical protein
MSAGRDYRPASAHKCGAHSAGTAGFASPRRSVADSDWPRSETLCARNALLADQACPGTPAVSGDSYPVFSAYPQELFYRAFFFLRYKPPFGDGTGMIAASAAVFGFAHIIFGNWVAIAMTASGGVLFGCTYRKTGSLVLTCLEHALFGDLSFTVGIGQFFYDRATLTHSAEFTEKV